MTRHESRDQDDLDLFTSRPSRVTTTMSEASLDRLYTNANAAMARRAEIHRAPIHGEGARTHEEKAARMLNRFSAMKTAFVTDAVTGKRVTKHYTQCACGFVSPHNDDKGLAFAAYEDHACLIAGADTAIDRAQAATGTMDTIVTPSEMERVLREREETASKDDLMQRVSLLELK